MRFAFVFEDKTSLKKLIEINFYPALDVDHTVIRVELQYSENWNKLCT